MMHRHTRGKTVANSQPQQLVMLLQSWDGIWTWNEYGLCFCNMQTYCRNCVVLSLILIFIWIPNTDIIILLNLILSYKWKSWSY